MSSLTREQVWHLVRAAHTVQQVEEAERVSRKWIREHPEDEELFQKALTRLEEKRRWLEETYE